MSLYRMYPRRGVKSIFHKIISMVREAVVDFWRDDCYTKAAALTFYTIQSIVPLLAVLLGVAKGFGFEDSLASLIVASFSEQREVFSRATEMAKTTLDQLNESWTAGVGVFFLLWSNINLFGYIESVLNQIWKTNTSRTLFQQIKDFTTIIIFCPIIIIISSGVIVYLKTKLTEWHGIAADSILWLFNGIPVLLTCLIFYFLYLLIPAVRLRWLSILVASVIAGLSFQLWQTIYVNFQMKIFNYSTVYGALAAIPLFLIWLQISWLIALFGAEIAAKSDKIFLCRGKM